MIYFLVNLYCEMDLLICLGDCRLLNVEFIELKGVLLQSIAALQDREVLFKCALDEYTTARRNYVVRAYIDALTRGGSLNFLE